MEADSRLVQRELCENFSVEPEQLVNTVSRFQEDIEDNRESIEKLSDFLGKELEQEEVNGKIVVEKSRNLFEERKELEKKIEGLESSIEDFLEEEINRKNMEELKVEVPTENVGLLIQIAQKLSNKNQTCITLIGEKGVVSACQTDESAREKLEELGSENVLGDEEFAKAFDI